MLDAYSEYNNCLIATVTYDAAYPILACYNSTIYSLTDADHNGYLTLDDIRAISRKL